MGVINFYREHKDTSPVQDSKSPITSGGVYNSLSDKCDSDCLGYPIFNENTTYSANDIVFHEGKLYYFNQAHAAGAWNSSEVSLMSIKASLQALAISKADRVQNATSGNLVSLNASGNIVDSGIPASAIDSGTAELLISSTRAEILAMRQAGTLVPGASYRITDYVATTTQPGTQSANHPFDIIVRATAPDTLSEEAFAAPHDGDTYFTGLGAKLTAWRLLYCIDNDTDRFIWADATNGKGVVYRMIDEWGNDAPYDFKGILILRDAAFWSSNAAATALAENTFGTQTPGDKYLYLFSAVDSEGNIIDASSTRVNVVIEDEPGGLVTCMENVFAGYAGGYTDDEENIYAIARNVFLAKISDEDWDHNFRVVNNTFNGYFGNNTFGGNMENNTFDGYVQNNVFSGTVVNNTFGGYMGNNTFAEFMENNTFDGHMENNTFSGMVSDSIFSGAVSYTTFDGDMTYCVFSGSVLQVTFQAAHDSGFTRCSFEGDLGEVTIAATGAIPQVATSRAFSHLRFVGKNKSGTAQTISVQQKAMYEQVVAADAGGILHVFTPWLNS